MLECGGGSPADIEAERTARCVEGDGSPNVEFELVHEVERGATARVRELELADG